MLVIYLTYMYSVSDLRKVSSSRATTRVHRHQRSLHSAQATRPPSTAVSHICVPHSDSPRCTSTCTELHNSTYSTNIQHAARWPLASMLVVYLTYSEVSSSRATTRVRRHQRSLHRQSAPTVAHLRAALAALHVLVPQVLRLHPHLHTGLHP